MHDVPGGVGMGFQHGFLHLGACFGRIDVPQAAAFVEKVYLKVVDFAELFLLYTVIGFRQSFIIISDFYKLFFLK